MEYDIVYIVNGVDPTDGKRKEWHRTSTRYGAEVAYDDAIEAGWTKLSIEDDLVPVRG